MDQLFCLLISIDWDGKINGLIVIRISSIQAVLKQTDYLTTVSEKTKVAHRYHYFDVWRVQKFLDEHPAITSGNLLENALQDSYSNDLPVVIGTRKYKGNDDFTGKIAQLDRIRLVLHYFNEHDLSSCGNTRCSWPRSITCASGVPKWPPLSRFLRIFFLKINCNDPQINIKLMVINESGGIQKWGKK